MSQFKTIVPSRFICERWIEQTGSKLRAGRYSLERCEEMNFPGYWMKIDNQRVTILDGDEVESIVNDILGVMFSQPFVAFGVILPDESGESCHVTYGLEV